MQLTGNYNLKKPEGTDIVNIDDFNANADIIDTQLKSLSTNKLDKTAVNNVQNYSIATQAEAEAGTSSAKYMTPQRTKQAIDKSLTPLQEQVNAHLAQTDKWDYMCINETITIDRTVDNIMRFGTKISTNGLGGNTNFVAANGDIQLANKGIYRVTISLTLLDSKYRLALRDANLNTISTYDVPFGKASTTFYITADGILTRYTLAILGDVAANPSTATIYADARNTFMMIERVV